MLVKDDVLLELTGGQAVLGLGTATIWWQWHLDKNSWRKKKKTDYESDIGNTKDVVPW